MPSRLLSRRLVLAAGELEIEAGGLIAFRLGEQVDVDAVFAAFEIHVDQVDMRAPPRP